LMRIVSKFTPLHKFVAETTPKFPSFGPYLGSN
jgi:hypothetical protein